MVEFRESRDPESDISETTEREERTVLYRGVSRVDTMTCYLLPVFVTIFTSRLRAVTNTVSNLFDY